MPNVLDVAQHIISSLLLEMEGANVLLIV